MEQGIMSKYLYLVSYTHDNQAGTCELHSDDEQVSVEQARNYVLGVNRWELASITAVQVQRQQRYHEPDLAPGALSASLGAGGGRERSSCLPGRG